jgi:2-dehydro-3-deoxy-D-arabinonate dehydratase
MGEAIYRVELQDGRRCLALGSPESGPAELIDGLSLDDLLAGAPSTLSTDHDHAPAAGQVWTRALSAPRTPLPGPARVLAPVESQEVWAAGVTYAPSRDARQAESAFAAAYGAVYGATRPELFFKATANRVRGPGEHVMIRSDSTWNVPEPEVALVLTSRSEIAAVTIGNDMSSRSIEGANPLYLPQAKVYDGSCALGPCLVPPPADSDLGIEVVIDRGGQAVFTARASASSMLRSFEELASWLGRALTFPAGAVLLTGTSIVPPPEFSLTEGDAVRITIDGIGTLANPVGCLSCGAPPADEAAVTGGVR